MNDVTRILDAVRQGDPRAAAELRPLVSGELRRLAAPQMARDKPESSSVILGQPHERTGQVPSSSPAFALPLLLLRLLPPGLRSLARCAAPGRRRGGRRLRQAPFMADRPGRSARPKAASCCRDCPTARAARPGRWPHYRPGAYVP